MASTVHDRDDDNDDDDDDDDDVNDEQTNTATSQYMTMVTTGASKTVYLDEISEKLLIISLTELLRNCQNNWCFAEDREIVDHCRLIGLMTRAYTLQLFKLTFNLLRRESYVSGMQST